MKRRAGGIVAALLCAAAPAVAAPPAIHLNQLGFRPDTVKRAIVATPATAPLGWAVVDDRGTVRARGRTTVFGADAASGDHVHRADFGALAAPGRYRLRIGDTTGHPFAVAPHLYAPLAAAALGYFRQSRAGVPITARDAGGAQWARAAGHAHEVAACFSGADEKGNLWPGCPYRLDVTGGWYDAGDQGKYVVNGGIALWTLLDLYETGAGRGARDAAALLDEARWEMRFLLAMQVPAGRRLSVPVGPHAASGRLVLTEIDAGGMAHHKVADRHWTGIPMRPADDREPRLLYPPSTAATLNLAATAARCARIWRTTDPAFARTCLTAAERAFAAARANPAVFAPESFTGSGSYGDTTLADEFFWATAELFATTHDARYGAMLRSMPSYAAPLAEPGWGSVAALGTITLATVPGALPPAGRDRQRAAIIAAADRFRAESDRSGYHIPYAATAYPWGSNAVILNRAIVLALAYRFTGAARYRDGVVDAMDYVLGRNPIDQSYVTGFGWKPLRNPHHRFWARQADPAFPPPPPGVLSGGPNSTAPADPVAATLKGCAPQRCFRDDIAAYALNEVAINWNAPLLWVATDLDAPARPHPMRTTRR